MAAHQSSPLSRRSLFLSSVAATVGCFVAIGEAALPPMQAVRVASGLSTPLFVTTPPNDPSRLFIVEQGSGGTAQIRILDRTTGTLNTTPFLSITGLSTTGEQGLLGLAFDPDYAANGKFYVDCVVPGGAYNNGVVQIRQYSVSGNPNVANAASGITLLNIDKPQNNHNGGWIGFSPRAGDDHNLYIAVGDGGNSYDQGTGHIEPTGNAQNPTTLLGKMLRIHIDPASGTYSIPANNPLAGSSDPNVKKEIFLTGLRNPFRNSFDRLTGDLFIGDVGQAAREELDVQKASNPGGGENYGWRLREGAIQTPNAVGGPAPGAVDPIFDYTHSTGQTVIGGYVYHGSLIPGLAGTLLFGDYLGPAGGGNVHGAVFAIDYDGASVSNFQDITALIDPTGQIGQIASFGEDANGELYIVDISRGQIFQLVPEPGTLAMLAAGAGLLLRRANALGRRTPARLR